MRKIKITFLLPFADLAGGVRVVVAFARQLHARGHQVAIYSMPPRVKRSPRSTQTDKAGELPVLADWRRPDRGFFAGLEFPHVVIDRYRPYTDNDLPDADILIACWYEVASGMMNLSRRKGLKVHFIQQYDANLMRRPKVRAVDRAWKLDTKKIVCSQWLRNLGRERFEIADIPVVENGVDLELFNSVPRSRSREPRVGFLFSPVPAKNVTLALHVIADLRQRWPMLKVLALGAELPGKVGSLPEGCEFHYRPRQVDLKKMYSSCDVWLCTSDSEGFHLPTHEAMACRSPVVSTSVGGPMDMIESGKDGILCPVGDRTGLGAAVSRLLTCDPAEWRRISEAGYRKARRYSWAAAGKRFEHVLNQFLVNR